MQELFSNNKNAPNWGRGVFYTYMSPCVNYCLNGEKEKCVVKLFEKYKGKINGIVFTLISGDAKDKNTNKLKKRKLLKPDVCLKLSDL